MDRDSTHLIIGYEKAARIAKHAIANGCTVPEAAVALGLMSQDEVSALLVPELPHPACTAGIGRLKPRDRAGSWSVRFSVNLTAPTGAEANALRRGSAAVTRTR